VLRDNANKEREEVRVSLVITDVVVVAVVVVYQEHAFHVAQFYEKPSLGHTLGSTLLS